MSKKRACLARERRILFLYGGFLSALPKYPAPAPWGGLCRGLQRWQGIFLEGFAYTQASRPHAGTQAALVLLASESALALAEGAIRLAALSLLSSVGCPE